MKQRAGAHVEDAPKDAISRLRMDLRGLIEIGHRAAFESARVWQSGYAAAAGGGREGSGRMDAPELQLLNTCTCAEQTPACYMGASQ